nr:keratinocyte-associated transmembrane protein 2 [Misgurnus anguillicaudatus]
MRRTSQKMAAVHRVDVRRSAMGVFIVLMSLQILSVRCNPVTTSGKIIQGSSEHPTENEETPNVSTTINDSNVDKPAEVLSTTTAAPIVHINLTKTISPAAATALLLPSTTVISTTTVVDEEQASQKANPVSADKQPTITIPDETKEEDYMDDITPGPNIGDEDINDDDGDDDQDNYIISATQGNERNLHNGPDIDVHIDTTVYTPRDEDSHFFFHLVIIAFLVAILYITYHNKRKIMLLAQSRRWRDGICSRGVDYHRLDQNVQEAMPSLKMTKDYVF